MVLYYLADTLLLTIGSPRRLTALGNNLTQLDPKPHDTIDGSAD